MNRKFEKIGIDFFFKKIGFLSIPASCVTPSDCKDNYRFVEVFIDRSVVKKKINNVLLTDFNRYFNSRMFSEHSNNINEASKRSL